MDEIAMEVIKVNRQGEDADGNAYDFMASPQMIDAGYMVNTPVVLEYPDGRLISAHRVGVTPAGIAFLQAELARHNGTAA
ncbi:Two component transcriptional regulator [Hyphomicrobiales bacterium]|jgi:hypothetical protein|nr:Two component transcriptional regulator [Hyphomicrobiales bacterium]CAH1696923.1 Two component transcriptional regulator [Hyphomicrobiales bacterium]